MHALSLSLVTLSALLGAVSDTQSDDRAQAASSVYTSLDDQASQLREEFNRHQGSVRLLFVVDPICPGCLRGLDDINTDLLATTDDPQLQTYVVHVPVIGAKAKDIAPAAKLLSNAHVHHYWNPSGEFGRQLAEAVKLKRGDEPVYAWDVWLIYGPEAVWNGPNPPQPRLLMHQLRALKDSTTFPRLDSKVFAQEARALLAKHPSVAATSATQE